MEWSRAMQAQWWMGYALGSWHHFHRLGNLLDVFDRLQAHRDGFECGHITALLNERTVADEAVEHWAGIYYALHHLDCGWLSEWKWRKNCDYEYVLCLCSFSFDSIFLRLRISSLDHCEPHVTHTIFGRNQNSPSLETNINSIGKTCPQFAHRTQAARNDFCVFHVFESGELVNRKKILVLCKTFDWHTQR